MGGGSALISRTEGGGQRSPFLLKSVHGGMGSTRRVVTKNRPRGKHLPFVGGSSRGLAACRGSSAGWHSTCQGRGERNRGVNLKRGLVPRAARTAPTHRRLAISKQQDGEGGSGWGEVVYRAMPG